MKKLLYTLILQVIIPFGAFGEGLQVFGYTTTKGSQGDWIEVYGSGFTELTSLTVTADSTAPTRPRVRNQPLNFTLVSDTQLHFRIDFISTFPEECYFVFESKSMDVVLATMKPFFVISETPPFGSGNPQFSIISSGVTVTSPSGGSSLIVSDGAKLTISGSGSNTIFALSGSEFTGFGGGGDNTLYYQQDSIVSYNSTGGGSVRKLINSFKAIEFLEIEKIMSGWLYISDKFYYSATDGNWFYLYDENNLYDFHRKVWFKI